MSNIFSGMEEIDERFAAIEIAGLVREGKLIKDQPKEIKKLAALPTAAARQDFLENIRVNYANIADAKDDRPSAADLVLYAEENNVDISTDAGLKKAMAALSKTPA